MSGGAVGIGAVSIGVGVAGAATAGEVEALVAEVLAEAGVDASAVACVGTLAALAGDARLTGLGWPVVGFAPEALAEVLVPSGGGDRARAAVGTASVAEAAALLAVGGGPGATVLVPKRRSARATVAVAVAAPLSPKPSRSDC